MSNRFLALALLVAIFAVAAAAASVDPNTAAAVDAAEVSQSKDDPVGNTDGAGAKDLAPAASEAVEGPVGGPVSAETLAGMSIDGPSASAPSPSSAACTLKGSSDVNVVAAVVIAAVARGFFL